MNHLNWSEDLTLGLDSLDDQHKELFSIANDLLKAIDRAEGETVLKEVFDRLKNYTESHFKEEEAYMGSIDFPGLDDHAEEHALLLMRVNTLWRLILSDEKISPKGVALFISDWISAHIMDSDGQIATYTQSLK
ncbi:MAG: hemerythrin family protein [Pseudodesulfovibrio sp.]